MIDIMEYARRIRRWKTLAASFFLGGSFVMVFVFMSRMPLPAKIEFGALGLFGLVVAGFFYYASMELPSKEVLQLAEDRNGLLTVSEICTALAINPDVAMRTLSHLQRIGVATPRWEEIQKNLWEFPDAVKLPIGQAIELAQAKGGRVSLRDLIASGHSPEVAAQTFDAIAQKGLGQQQGESGGRHLVLEST